MRQEDWDRVEIRHWAKTLRARSQVHPLSPEEKARLPHFVLKRIQRWVKVFPPRD